MNRLSLFFLFVFHVGRFPTFSGDLTVVNGSTSEEGQEILFDGVKVVSSDLGLFVVGSLFTPKEVLEDSG